MNVSGEHRVTATRERVWQALHDAEVVRLCIPGCEDVQAVERHIFAGRMMTRIGAVSTVFTGQLRISDERYPKSWQVAAHAESPSAGWADGIANIRLTSATGGTVIAYRLHVAPGGRLAAMGDRLLRGAAMRMANDFFTRLTELLMPDHHSGEPQDRAQPAGAPPRRKVQPLAPDAAATTHHPPAPVAAERGPFPLPRGQRIIIGVGLAYCAFVWLSMALALLHRT